jgi:predicted transcriptional regulator
MITSGQTLIQNLNKCQQEIVSTKNKYVKSKYANDYTLQKNKTIEKEINFLSDILLQNAPASVAKVYRSLVSANKKNKNFAVSTIASAYELSVSSVNRAIRFLTRYKFIERTRRNKISSVTKIFRKSEVDFSFLPDRHAIRIKKHLISDVSFLTPFNNDLNNNKDIYSIVIENEQIEFVDDQVILAERDISLNFSEDIKTKKSGNTEIKV